MIENCVLFTELLTIKEVFLCLDFFQIVVKNNDRCLKKLRFFFFDSKKEMKINLNFEMNNTKVTRKYGSSFNLYENIELQKNRLSLMRQ